MESADHEISGIGHHAKKGLILMTIESPRKRTFYRFLCISAAAFLFGTDPVQLLINNRMDAVSSSQI